MWPAPSSLAIWIFPPPHKFAALLGENSEEILKELGYSDEKIQKMIASKVTSVWTDPIPEIKE